MNEKMGMPEEPELLDQDLVNLLRESREPGARHLSPGSFTETMLESWQEQEMAALEKRIVNGEMGRLEAMFFYNLRLARIFARSGYKYGAEVGLKSAEQVIENDALLKARGDIKRVLGELRSEIENLKE